MFREGVVEARYDLFRSADMLPHEDTLGGKRKRNVPLNEVVETEAAKKRREYVEQLEASNRFSIGSSCIVDMADE